MSVVKTGTQEQRILALLQASYPAWTPALVLSKVSLQYSARIFSLRRKGWQIANKVEVQSDGTKHGYFRLAQPLTFPNPQRPVHPEGLAQFNRATTLFGDLSPVHKDLG